MGNSFLFSYSPIRSLSSAYPQNNDEIALDIDTKAESKTIENTDEDTMLDLLRVDSFFRFHGKLISNPIRASSDILRENGSLLQACISTKIPPESSTCPGIETVYRETVRSHSSSFLLGGRASEETQSTSEPNACKFNLPESSSSKDKVDTTTEQTLGEIDSNSISCFIHSTGKSTAFGPLTMCPPITSAELLDSQSGRLFSMSRPVGQPVNRVAPVKLQPPIVPATVAHRQKPSVRFTTSTFDIPPIKNKAYLKLPKTLHMLKNISMPSPRDRHYVYSLFSSHRSESGSYSPRIRPKPKPYILSEIKPTQSSEATHIRLITQ
ncbi:unnamed protein product [Phytomonas sp. Hart1]|nr:unnamed protein product [Phytomonas sp. Hart1]|eukprot:CCW69202.1 unnamed protein product [Phytomonas sp. isolate Hart1]